VGAGEVGDRVKLALLLVLVGVAHADATWPQIEKLAAPSKRGPSEKLDQAIDFAAAHEDAQALAALHDWVVAKGGLPPYKVGFDGHKRSPMPLAKLAVDGSAFADAAYLAKVMIEDAGAPAAIENGAKTLRRIRARTPEKLPAVKVDLVRTIAVDALHAKASDAWMHTADGQKALNEFFDGKPPDPALFEAELAFFLKALDGAKRGEPIDTTLDRVDKARDEHTLGFDRARIAQAIADISELAK